MLALVLLLCLDYPVTKIAHRPVIMNHAGSAIAMASLIPRLGYLAVCLGLALSRIGAGFAAALRYRRFMRHRRQNTPDACITNP